VNSGPLIFLGSLFTLALSFWGLLLAPQLQIGQQQEVQAQVTSEQYPTPRPGLAEEGAGVYRANGCMECHTQQVRPAGLGSDLDRGWGKRRAVAQDYLRDYPVMLGELRLGPDLSNIGSRQPDANWHLKHLYSPKSMVERSLMPPYRYLFETRPLPDGQPPSSEDLGVGLSGYEVVPRREARALSAYLLSLRADRVSLLEAPLPAPDTNDVTSVETNVVETVPGVEGGDQ